MPIQVSDAQMLHIIEALLSDAEQVGMFAGASACGDEGIRMMLDAMLDDGLGRTHKLTILLGTDELRSRFAAHIAADPNVVARAEALESTGLGA